MPVTWGDFRYRVRRVLLQDNPADITKRRWSDENLMDYVASALDSLCAHTAMATATSFAGVTGTTLTLPGNIFTDLDKTGVVLLQAGSEKPLYVNPVYYTRELGPVTEAQGFYTTGIDQLVLTKAITAPTNVYIRYFAYYNHPAKDEDTIDCPQWMLSPLGWMLAAHAITGYSMRADQIRQWGENPETGKPTDNPFRVQQQWLYGLVEEEYARAPKQDRTNFFRKGV